MNPNDESAALAHQQELEHRRQVEEWQFLLSEDPHWVEWSQRLRDDSEQQQSKEIK